MSTWRRKPLSRRTFLRGAGAALGLPLLEAMLPGSLSRAARAATEGPPRRFLTFYVPNGIQMSDWTPATDGPGYALTPALQALTPFKDRLTVLSGLANAAAVVPVAGDHARGTGSFLTCETVLKTGGVDIQNGISIDQVIANHLKACTPFPSLELGAEGGDGAGECDSGYSCAYTRHVAWADATTPLAKETSPQELFDRLFGELDQTLTAEEVAQRRFFRKSVLDAVHVDTKALHSKLGAGDRAKLDQYLTAIEALEQQIDKTAENDTECYPGAKPPVPEDVRDQVRMMSDLTVLALQCDLSRVVTFMLGNAGSGRVYDFLGMTDGHHYLSHHQDDPVKRAALKVIDQWEVEQFAYLLERLDAVTEPTGGTLLDSSAVFFSSEIEDGNSHAHANLPVLLAGTAGGALTTGQHLSFPAWTPIADLFVAIQNAMGVGATSFGSDGTQPLAGLLV